MCGLKPVAFKARSAPQGLKPQPILPALVPEFNPRPTFPRQPLRTFRRVRIATLICAQRLIDFVGGVEDLDAGVVRAIGRADARFEEDHLRIAARSAVRGAIRF